MLSIDTRWNFEAKFAKLSVMWVMVATLHVATAFDISKMTPIADRNLRTGNKMLIEKQNYYDERHATTNENVNASGNAHAVAVDGDDGVLDVNEIPVRYDEAQLWRIYNISDAMRHKTQMPLADILENRYGKYFICMIAAGESWR